MSEVCQNCGATFEGPFCPVCAIEVEQFEAEELKDKQRLEKEGHTAHCASRIVWGDGVCECGKNKK